MTDIMSIFVRQFHRVEEGYVYYDGRGGGKLVTEEEYERLLIKWKSHTGFKGLSKILISVIVAVGCWDVISRFLSLPDWTNQIFGMSIVLAIMLWAAWVNYAPWRLVKNRVAVVPPLSPLRRGQEARALLRWHQIILVGLLSGAILIGNLSQASNGFGWWIWTLLSGIALSGALWAGTKKYADRHR